MNEKITPDMLSSVNWLFVNEVEAEQLCGSNQPEICLDRLSALCPKGAVILTLAALALAMPVRKFIFSNPPSLYRQWIPPLPVIPLLDIFWLVY